jgi:hypothetical protein
MISLILLAFALIAFVVAGSNGTLFGQPPGDLVAWGLGLWVLATLLSGYGPAAPKLGRGN